MAKLKFPVTAAIRALREEGISFVEHACKYHENEVAVGTAEELGIDLHLVIKTLVMEDDRGSPLIILMHGDNQVSTKDLARTIGVKSVQAASHEAAQKHTGYVIGGISPFGLRKSLPIYVEASILRLPRLFINGGKRGFTIEISSEDLARILNPMPVNVAR
ncbi:MAG: Cys-tRNA(Pro) deacylase [Proteobacteria bacterium]|nr:Cys-tRNA(Pro) deacylase [Pseudomonadota bacterium]NIS67859.1 Cys-tRNA(Pro) deacylase [Pseudomonadota bacterium]